MSLSQPQPIIDSLTHTYTYAPLSPSLPYFLSLGPCVGASLSAAIRRPADGRAEGSEILAAAAEQLRAPEPAVPLRDASLPPVEGAVGCCAALFHVGFLFTPTIKTLLTNFYFLNCF